MSDRERAHNGESDLDEALLEWLEGADANDEEMLARLRREPETRKRLNELLMVEEAIRSDAFYKGLDQMLEEGAPPLPEDLEARLLAIAREETIEPVEPAERSEAMPVGNEQKEGGGSHPRPVPSPPTGTSEGRWWPALRALWADLPRRLRALWAGSSRPVPSPPRGTSEGRQWRALLPLAAGFLLVVGVGTIAKRIMDKGPASPQANLTAMKGDETTAREPITLAIKRNDSPITKLVPFSTGEGSFGASVPLDAEVLIRVMRPEGLGTKKSWTVKGRLFKKVKDGLFEPLDVPELSGTADAVELETSLGKPIHLDRLVHYGFEAGDILRIDIQNENERIRLDLKLL